MQGARITFPGEKGNGHFPGASAHFAAADNVDLPVIKLECSLEHSLSHPAVFHTQPTEFNSPGHFTGRSNVTESNVNEASSAPVPDRIGNYLIQDEIGSGGMGTVYLAEHVETHAQVAVKILPASLSREPGFIARFGREIAAMQQLSSPQIVELYESGEDHGIYYYAMEYVRGETLTSRLKRDKRIPWREVIELGVQLCKALKSAHNSGIVHRDLKPSNLLIDPDGNVKLTDFGIAQVFATSKLTVTGGILGTAEYMSPEQAQGSRATRQSDIYSLGAVLYVMLTGRPPFTGKTTLEIIQKHRFSQFDSPKRIVPDIPHWLDEIVCKCLAKKPEDRYPDAYVLMLRLQEVPRKVDMKEGTVSHGTGWSGDHETLAQTGSAQEQHIGGTFVRDLFRAEMETKSDATLLGRALDNVWVLAAVLILLLGGGLFYAMWSKPSPEQLFARGQALMDQPEGPQWEVARTQFFEPLLKLNEEYWRPRIEPYQAKLQLFDLKRQLLGRNHKLDPLPETGPEAILRQALDLRKTGRISQAREKLAALEVLTAGSEEWKQLGEIAAKLKEELSPDQIESQLEYVKEALARADKLHSAGETSAARAIWRSVQELYDADPDAAAYVQQARQHLQTIIPAAETTPSATDQQ